MTIETFEEISVELKKRIGHLEVSVDNLMIILQYVLEVVELTKAKGPQKKAFAISLLKQIIDEADINQNEKSNCYVLINNGTVSNTIDLVITASKKKTKLNKHKSLVKRILCRRKNKHAENLQKRHGSGKRQNKDKDSNN